MTATTMQNPTAASQAQSGTSPISWNRPPKAATTGVDAHPTDNAIATRAGQMAKGSPEAGLRRFDGFTGAKSAEPPSRHPQKSTRTAG